MVGSIPTQPSMITHGTREWYVYHFVLACTLKYPVLTFEMKFHEEHEDSTSYQIIIGNKVNNNKHYFILSSNDSGGIKIMEGEKFEFIGHLGLIMKLFLIYFL